MIDGAEYVPTDANGNVVEPFIYNGTTYLPVRAVANAFGKDVKWDGKNAIVYIGKDDRMEPDNRLDKMQYMNYWEDGEHNYLEKINGTIKDYNGNIYTNGMLVYICGFNFCRHNVSFEYPLNCQYETLKGKIVLPKSIHLTTREEDDCKTSETTVIILDDDENVLFEGTGINASMPFEFDLDVRGLNKIKFKVNAEGDYSYIALTDLALYE